MIYTRQDFISVIAPLAIEDMRSTNIPASLTIAQAILESNNGNSDLAQLANNLFGIKGNGNAGTYITNTLEYIDGEPTTVQARFRKYNSWQDSIDDHSRLLIFGVSWNRELYHGAIGVDGLTAAKEIAKAGYATDPNYFDKLVNLMNQHNLYQYDIPPINEVSSSPLSERVEELFNITNELIKNLNQLNDRTKPIPPPDWFTNEFPNALQLLSDQTGSYEFWRSYAITLRTINESIK